MSKTLDMIALKGALRAEMRQRLRAMSAEDRQLRSEIIRDRVLHLNVWKQAKSIVFFSPLPNEPDIALLAQLAARMRKRLRPFHRPCEWKRISSCWRNRI